MNRFVLLSGVAMIASVLDAGGASAQTNWSGPYLGLSVGAGALSANNNLSQPWDSEGYGSKTVQNTSAGLVGGVFAGYNYQVGNGVFGVEADFSGLTINNAITVGHVDSYYDGIVNNKVSALGSFRARAGVDMGGTLAYLTGGLAVGNFRNSYTVSEKGINFNRSSWRVGWIAGVGVEHQINQKISLRAEVLYAGFGSTSISDGGGYFSSSEKIKVSNDVTIARLGLAFKF